MKLHRDIKHQPNNSLLWFVSLSCSFCESADKLVLSVVILKCFIQSWQVSNFHMKDFLRYHFGYYNNLVTIAMRYVADVQGHSVPNMNSMQLRRKELLRYHCGYHGNLVSIAVRYVADACHPKKASH